MSHPPEDQILFEIGAIADSFARLEYNISNILSFLVNDKNLEIGQIISDRLTLNQTVNLISELLSINYDVLLISEFKKISKNIQKAATYRNDIIHSTWATPASDDDITGDIIQERARKRYIEPKYHELDALLKKMEESIFFIQETEIALTHFSQKIKTLRE